VLSIILIPILKFNRFTYTRLKMHNELKKKAEQLKESDREKQLKEEQKILIKCCTSESPYEYSRHCKRYSISRSD
jgi:hypothetical protein